MTIKIPRLYTGVDGKSHWGELELDFVPELKWDPSGKFGRSKKMDADTVWFRHAPSGAGHGWGPAPARQLVFTLSGEVEYETGDGERRRFGPGSVFLAEDTTGKGHTSYGVGDAPRLSMFVRLKDQGGEKAD